MKILVADKISQSGIDRLRGLGCDVVCAPDLAVEALVRALADVKEAWSHGEVTAIWIVGTPEVEGLRLEELGEGVSLLNIPFSSDELLDRMRSMVHPTLAEAASTDPGLQRRIR